MDEAEARARVRWASRVSSLVSVAAAVHFSLAH